MFYWGNKNPNNLVKNTSEQNATFYAHEPDTVPGDACVALN